MYPKWGEQLGIAMSIMSMMWIPLYMIYYLCKGPGTFLEVRIIKLIFIFIESMKNWIFFYSLADNLKNM